MLLRTVTGGDHIDRVIILGDLRNGVGADCKKKTGIETILSLRPVRTFKINARFEV